MTFFDYAIILTYLLALLILGFIRSQNAGKNFEEYVVAGRRLSLPAFVATLVTTWYGGILGVGEFSYSFGISNWLVFGVPYYLYALIFAFWLAGRARRSILLTIPEQLERVYGKTAGLLGAFFVFLLTTPAPYVLMLAVLAQMLLAWPLWLGLLVGTFFSMIYSFRGGLAAIVRTEILQFVLMFAGFFLILYFSVTRHGGWSFLQAHLPSTHLTWHGGNSPQYILVWYFIAMSTLVDPTFYQRCFAARSEKVARYGILFSVVCWLVFDFMTTTAGLYARALLPDLNNPMESYPRLALHVLPAAMRRFFYLALFATIMSTIDGFAFTAAVTFGKDFLSKILNKDSETALTFFTRIGLVVAFMLAVGIAWWAQSIVKIWYQLGTLATPALLLPLLTSFSERWKIPPRWAVASMIASASVTGLWMLGSSDGGYWWNLEPIYPGLATAAILFLGAQASRRFSVQNLGGSSGKVPGP